MCYSSLKRLLFAHQSLNLLERILAREVFQNDKTLSQVFILVLQLEDFCVLVIDKFRLLLNCLSETEITLQHLFHHIDCVNDSPGDRIFRLVCSVVAHTTLSDNSARRTNSISIDPLDLFSIGHVWHTTRGGPSRATIRPKAILTIGLACLLGDC